jgi:hypothetical protein
MHPESASQPKSLVGKALMILDRLGFSKRASRRRRALLELSYASEYLKSDIGFYEALPSSPDDAHTTSAAASRPIRVALDQPTLLACR